MEYPEENTKKPRAGGSDYELSEAAGGKSILPAPSALAAASAQDREGLRSRWQHAVHRAVRLRQRWPALLPGHCLLCGIHSKAQTLCPACRSDLPALAVAHCPRCLESTSHGERCGRCLTQPPLFDGVFAAYAYDFPLDKLIHAFKYGQQLALADWFAVQLAQLLAPQQAEYGWTCLIPLPLHRRRLAERGFNQALEIARPLCQRLRIPCDSRSLTRIRAGAPQASLPLKERLRHLRDAFACSRDLRQHRILLLDDVLTSGSTASECARMLKRHGAGSVHVAVIARALRD